MAKNEKKQTIGFIGLGGIGRGLVKNLLKHGYEVTAFDIDQDALKSAKEQDASKGNNIRTIAGAVDNLGICVTIAELVQELMLGPDSALKKMKQGAVFLDHIMTSPDHVDKMRAA